MKRILSFVSIALLCFLTLSCSKESPISKTENWTVFTVGYNAPFSAHFKSSNFQFYLGQNYQGYTTTKDRSGFGICLLNNVAELDKIEDFDDLSYQERIVLYEGACAVESYIYNGYSTYTAFIIDDWNTSTMLGRYKLIQVKYPDGKIYSEPIEE